VEIDTVQQRTGHAGTITGHMSRIACAPVSFRPVQPARAPVRTTITPVSSAFTWSLGAERTTSGLQSRAQGGPFTEKISIYAGFVPISEAPIRAVTRR
jgi:hypothetical protein